MYSFKLIPDELEPSFGFLAVEWKLLSWGIGGHFHQVHRIASLLGPRLPSRGNPTESTESASPEVTLSTFYYPGVVLAVGLA